MPNLAINGGKPVRTKFFPDYITIGEEEKKEVMKVLDSGNLSQFLGVWHEDFYGGPKIQEFEKRWAEVFNVKYAISVNSNTSGLYAAMGACDIQPGDEVIVSPYTMTAGAIAPLIYGAVPVFADVDDENFGLSPKSIEDHITDNTKAILLVHIFGNPSKMDEIVSIAQKHDLKIIEDCAQSPMATYKNKNVGTIGELGVFSLNYHKHIHTGEGGMITTNDESIAEKLYLIRNHGEAVVKPKGTDNLVNTYGFNYRMTEIQAAIGIEQLKKLPYLLEERIKNANYLTKSLSEIDYLEKPFIESIAKHVYYAFPYKYNKRVHNIHRNKFIDAVKAELPSSRLREKVPLISYGYTEPLYMQPIYQKRISKCAFNCPKYNGSVSYQKGDYPNVEKLHYDDLFTHEFMRPGMTKGDLQDVVDAFFKVSNNLDELR